MSSSISLPFSISNAYQGFAKAGGILAATDRELVLELEVKDGLVGVLKSSNVVKIPIDSDHLSALAVILAETSPRD